MTNGRAVERGIKQEFFNAVSTGGVPGFRSVVVESKNSQVDLVEEDVWEGGGFLEYLSAAETIGVVSDSAADTIAGGTGGQVVVLEGVDGNYDLITEVVLLTGTVIATTINTFLRLHQMTVVVYGTNEFTVGTITATASTALTVQCLILPAVGQSRNNQISVPAGETATVVNLQFGVVGTAGAGKAILLVRGYARLFGSGGWFQTFERQVRTEVAEGFEANQTVQPPIPEKSDLRVTVVSDSMNTIVNFRAYLMFQKN